MGLHDAFSLGTSQNLAFSTSAGTAASTAGFNSQTRYLRLVATGIPTATNGVRYVVGTAPVAASTSTYLPLNWVEFIRIGLGERVSALGTDTTAGTLNITECLT